jgi:hypothetical protein
MNIFLFSADRNLTSNTSFALPDGYGIYFNPSGKDKYQTLYKPFSTLPICKSAPAEN